MASHRKANILTQHEHNQRLNTPSLAQVMRNTKDLSADEMLSPLDERIIASAAEALEAGETHYVDVPGIAPLRSAMAQFLNDSSGSGYQQENIIITAGLQESRFLTIQKIGELYDSIGIPAVVHPGVQKALGVRQRNVLSLPVDSERGYLASTETIAAAIADGCRLFFLESPSRLSGAIYSPDEVEAIHQIIKDSDAAVIWDQGLALWVDGNYCALASKDKDIERTATIGEAFPGMGLASWLIGYIAAPQAWVPSMQSQKQIMAICTSTAAQYAALEASSIFEEPHNRQLAQLRGYRQAAKSAAQGANLHPVAGDSANILALRCPQNKKAIIAQLRQAGYDAADGDIFGAPDLIRLTINNATVHALQALS